MSFAHIENSIIRQICEEPAYADIGMRYEHFQQAVFATLAAAVSDYCANEIPFETVDRRITAAHTAQVRFTELDMDGCREALCDFWLSRP